MTSGDNGKKGFGAFDDLVSDVSKEVETPVQRRAAATEPVKDTRVQPQEDSSPSAQSQKPKAAAIPPNTSGGSKGGAPWGWIAFGVFVFVVLAIIADSEEKRVEVTAVPASNYQEPYTPTVPEAAAPAAEPSASAPVATVNSEEKPPVGDGLVFSYNQIRYCLSEDIRLGAINDALDNYSQFEVDRFNAAIGDYNSRCSNFRYRRGALESIRAEVNPLHASLVLEGLHRLDSWRGSVPQPTKAELIEVAKDAPSEPGASGTNREPSGESIISGLRPDERSSIESVCNGEKLLYGPAAYYKCLASQKSKLAKTPSPPDLSMLNPDERSSIESVCNGEKILYGPAAYYKCLSSQKTQLATGSSAPDMSNLTADERSSIESVCNGEKLLYGPAAYYKCLQYQVRKLR